MLSHNCISINKLSSVFQDIHINYMIVLLSFDMWIQVKVFKQAPSEIQLNI